jgi:hypothetical protein
MFCCCFCCGFFALLLAPQGAHIEAMYGCAIAGARFALRNRFWAARFCSLAPSSFKQALRFRQCSLASVGFCYSLGNITTRKKSMTTKTPSQRIALLEAKLARAKADERKQRTRRLIEVCSNAGKPLANGQLPDR